MPAASTMARQATVRSSLPAGRSPPAPRIAAQLAAMPVTSALILQSCFRTLANRGPSGTVTATPSMASGTPPPVAVSAVAAVVVVVVPVPVPVPVP